VSDGLRFACLPRSFYLRPTRQVARDLLGCVLVSARRGVVAAGRIVETEAYLGPEDAASHAAIRPLASRERFYGEGGAAYVFRIYGLHHCINAITGSAGRPGCVLIRALEPIIGTHVMARRRGLPADSPGLTNGPGKLAQALAVTGRHNGADLTRGALVIGPPVGPRHFRIAVGPRIGITRATLLPLRFWIASNRYVSRATRGAPTRRRRASSRSWSEGRPGVSASP
jgi:DNA-3-methyladenine glycosylase